MQTPEAAIRPALGGDARSKSPGQTLCPRAVARERHLLASPTMEPVGGRGPAMRNTSRSPRLGSAIPLGADRLEAKIRDPALSPLEIVS